MRDSTHRTMSEFENRTEMADARIRELETELKVTKEFVVKQAEVIEVLRADLTTPNLESGRQANRPADSLVNMARSDSSLPTDAARVAAREIADQTIDVLRSAYPAIKWPRGTISSLAFDVISKHLGEAIRQKQ